MGATLIKQEGEFVEQGELIAEWDPFSVPIITDVSGIVEFRDISEGETFKEQVEEVSGVCHFGLALAVLISCVVRPKSIIDLLIGIPLASTGPVLWRLWNTVGVDAV